MTNGANQETLKSGDLLIIQGEEPKYIYFLMSGSLEILSAPEEFDGLDRGLILQKSKRVGVIKGKSLISGLSILFTEPYSKSIRAMEECQVRKYPLKEGGFRQISQSDPSFAIIILSHVFKRLELSMADARKYTLLYQNLSRINDNIALISRELSGDEIPEKVAPRVENLYETYKENGGDFPTRFDSKFLVKDNSNILQKKYSFPGLPMESLIDIKQCNFLRRFVGLDNKLLGAMIHADPTIPTYIFTCVTDNLLKVLERIENIHNSIDEELSYLFGADSSWASFLVDEGKYDLWMASGRLSDEFLKNFVALAIKVHSFYEEISGGKLSQIYPGFKKLHGFFQNKQETAPAAGTSKETKTAAGTVSPSNINALYNNSIHQIFEFSLVDKEFQKNFLKLLNEFRNMKDPMSTESDGRKIRRHISRFYWDLFGKVFVRAKSEPQLPQPVKLMLNFGFLDENLIDEEQLQELHQLSLKLQETTELPIHYEREFLTRIYNEEEVPSITEMGLTYEQHLREEERHKKKKELEKDAALDANLRKVFFEIGHRVSQTVAICYGSTASAFPILTSYAMKGNPTNFYVSKKNLETIINDLRDIDFSVFYREVSAMIGDNKELIKEEVVPDFILVPSFGTKTMLWQELVGTNRRTRGRITVPIFFMGDLKKSLAHTFATFRWELNRTIMGGLWADPIDGGLTGLYFDYINTYKKNPKLSLEAKNKVTERFKSIRTNRDRFADDYVMWLLYEKDGIMKLNGVVRDMFYKQIPFKKDIRERLENMPAYNEIANRFKNVHTREVTGYQRRFKKYSDEEGNLPEKLQQFMDFLNK
ncbi:MAG: Crp/Fnr family transcriptional regulator [Spirochaetota bacterium]